MMHSLLTRMSTRLLAFSLGLGTIIVFAGCASPLTNTPVVPSPSSVPSPNISKATFTPISPKPIPTLEIEFQNNPDEPGVREDLARAYLDSAIGLLNSYKIDDLQQARELLTKTQIVIGPFPKGNLAELLKQVSATLEIVNRNLVAAYVRRANDGIATKDRKQCKDAQDLLKKALQIAPQNTDVQNATAAADKCMQPILIAQGSRDFSSKQGSSNWQYLIKTSAGIQPLIWDTVRGVWSTTPSWIRLDSTGGHPSFEPDAVIRRWVSNVNVQIQVRIAVHKIDCGGDGVRVTFEMNGKYQWGQSIAGCDRTGISWTSPTLPVKVGDLLDFDLYANGDTTFDSTYYDPSIYQVD
jgi:hypothetical protein